MIRALCGQTFCNAQTIHRLYPIEALGNHAALIGLQRSDEMPLQMKFRMVCTKPINFCTAFLSIIFAKGKRAGTCAFQKSLLVKSFPNGQKLDASLRPSRLLFGFRQHLLYVCKPLFQAWLKFAHCFSFS